VKTEQIEEEIQGDDRVQDKVIRYNSLNKVK
jgi:hypothetical protein